MKGGTLVARYLILLAVFAFAGMAHGWGQGQAGAGGGRSTNNQSSKPRAVIYVMPTALVGPAPSDGTQMLLDSAREGREPQVAKIYQELQHDKNCQGFSENIVKEKADYFLLLQHGGGRGNRWFATGQSFRLGTSVNDACAAIAKDWQQRPPSMGK